MLPLSHDEVVHGKGSLLRKMPGDPWQAFANLRSLFGYMWGHPGKKLLFMGGEFAQVAEFSENRSLDWHLLQYDTHKGVQRLVTDLNTIYQNEPALWEMDIDHAGFQWIESSDSDNSVFAFLRWDRAHQNSIIVLLNATPVPRYDYKIGVPIAGEYIEILNTDASEYGGSNVRCHRVQAYAGDFGYFPASLHVTLPPLGVVWLKGPPVPPAPASETP
jgi:1,4-alpha-glucan branching enzyme